MRKSSLHTGTRRLIAIWIAACFVVGLITVQTLTLRPLIHQDEVQILEYGRTALDPLTDWSINWNVAEEIPVLSPAWLGSMVQELAYQTTAPSNFGSRLATMISGMMASTCLLGWLLARRTPAFVALALALVLLLDPVFADKYRGGRIDGWAFAACLGACWSLRVAYNRKLRGVHSPWHLFAAGVLVGLSPFLWLNAPILVPLVLLELYYLIRLEIIGVEYPRWRAATGQLVLFGAGGVLAFGLALLPIFAHWEIYWEGMIANVQTQAHAAAIKNSLVGLFAVHDPIIAIVAIVALAIHREWPMIVAFLLASLIIYQTMVYMPRVMYLLPYLLAMIAAAVTSTHFRESNRNFGFVVMSWALALLLTWNLVTTLVVRSVLSTSQFPANEPEQVLNRLRQSIGSGPYRVLVEEWSAYIAGRSLGWHQYRAGVPYEQADYLDLLQTMDYLVLREVPFRNHTLNLVDEAGFELQETIRFPIAKARVIAFWNLEFFFPEKGYYPMNIYRRAGEER